MQISCPFCGKRSLSEFIQHGDATKRRPELSNENIADWTDFVYLRENPKGIHREYWQHSGGCRAWLVVTRNTATHEVLKVENARLRTFKAEESVE